MFKDPNLSENLTNLATNLFLNQTLRSSWSLFFPSLILQGQYITHHTIHILHYTLYIKLNTLHSTHHTSQIVLHYTSTEGQGSTIQSSHSTKHITLQTLNIKHHHSNSHVCYWLTMLLVCHSGVKDVLLGCNRGVTKV